MVIIHSKTTVELSQEYGCTTAFQIPVFEVRDASICCHPAICFLGSLKQTSYDVCLMLTSRYFKPKRFEMPTLGISRLFAQTLSGTELI
jgi:hypothetical protein